MQKDVLPPVQHFRQTGGETPVPRPASSHASCPKQWDIEQPLVLVLLPPHKSCEHSSFWSYKTVSLLQGSWPFLYRGGEGSQEKRDRWSMQRSVAEVPKEVSIFTAEIVKAPHIVEEENLLVQPIFCRQRWIGRWILPEWRYSSWLLPVEHCWISCSVPYFIFRFLGVPNTVIFILFCIYFFITLVFHGLHHIIVFSGGDGFLIVTHIFTP